MEAPVTGTTLHSFDRHRQSLHKEDQGDPSVIQKIRMHPASSGARAGKQKSKRDRTKQSDNESVLYVSLFLSASFHLITTWIAGASLVTLRISQCDLGSNFSDPSNILRRRSLVCLPIASSAPSGSRAAT